VKIHLLHVLKNTKLAEQYMNKEFSVMEMQEYVETVCDQLELFSEETVIQRVTGDGEKDSLIAPLWSLKKFCVMNEIDKEMGRRNSWQGKALSE
jgi:radical SAM superfamily enzyme